MMKIPYYPGCTLNTNAKDLEECAVYSAKALGFSMEEMKDWNCCGASLPLTTNSAMGYAGPTNVLLGGKEEGAKEGMEDKLVTLCAVCYNVLKRTNYAFSQDKDKLSTINSLLDKDYKGDTNVVHYLEVLRDDIGYDVLKEKVSRELKGLKVAPYYGCFLLRPHKEVGLDDPYAPTIFEGLLKALGCEVVDFSHKGECCGSYSAMSNPEGAAECSYSVIDAAAAAGADIIATTCPLCQYNLDGKQDAMKKKHGDMKEMPVVYFTQLLSMALGMDLKKISFKSNSVNPLPLLKEKGLV